MTWRPPPAAVDLRPDAVEVWRASLDAAEGDMARFEASLPPEERARADRFAFPGARRAFVAGRGMLRELLARYAGGSPASQEIVADPDGKPRLAGPCGQGRVRFNASHSGGLWTCAVALHREVGIDVEAIDPSRRIESIMGRYFAPAEAAAVRGSPDPLRAFHRVWTRKEAWLKARGTGITVPLDSFEVSAGEEARLVAAGGRPPGEGAWTLRDLDFGPGFAGALSCEGEVREVRTWRAS